jgi:hypothetical protein
MDVTIIDAEKTDGPGPIRTTRVAARPALLLPRGHLSQLPRLHGSRHDLQLYFGGSRCG